MVTVGFQAYVEEAPSALNHRPYQSLLFFNQYSADMDCVNGTSSFQVPTSVINARNWHVVANEHTESEAIALDTSFFILFSSARPVAAHNLAFFSDTFIRLSRAPCKHMAIEVASHVALRDRGYHFSVTKATTACSNCQMQVLPCTFHSNLDFWSHREIC